MTGRRSTDPQPGGGEWWRTVELGGGDLGMIVFADPGDAGAFARHLLGDGAPAVAVEHWRDGRCEGISLIGPATPAPPAD